MKHFIAVLITAFTFLFIGQASAATSPFNEKSLDSFNSPLVCADDDEKKKKKKKGEEEEPECE
ncbi:MAG: hypothetical protein KAI17_12935 [Thiotrichaceae bacterium]|nr:hypothetical protein [Thiotrichaceae bacterium]